MMWARAVSAPIFSALKRSMPVVFIVAAYTGSPVALSVGMLSPVSMDSSTAECPSRTEPSTGIFAPGRTTTTSPISTSSMGISFSAPSLKMTAVFGARPMSFLMASPVRPFETASRVLPMRMSAKMTPAVSKYSASTASRWPEAMRKVL